MKRMAGFLVFLLLVLVVLAGFLFMLNNETPVALWMGRSLGPASLGFWVLSGFAAGAVLGLFAGYGLWSKFQLRLELRRLRRELQQERSAVQALQQRLGHGESSQQSREHLKDHPGHS